MLNALPCQQTRQLDGRGSGKRSVARGYHATGRDKQERLDGLHSEGRPHHKLLGFQRLPKHTPRPAHEPPTKTQSMMDPHATQTPSKTRMGMQHTMRLFTGLKQSGPRSKQHVTQVTCTPPQGRCQHRHNAPHSLAGSSTPPPAPTAPVSRPLPAPHPAM